MLAKGGSMDGVATWRPALGAWLDEGGVRFRVWAPERRRVEVLVEGQAPRPLGRDHEGYWEGSLPGLGAGALYRYRLDDEGPYPDPASRFQPRGVHGPSQVVDPGTFPWTDGGWSGVALEDAAIYELHVGTFTPEGTFAAIADRLPALRDLGVTLVELMPVAAFPGRWNWGYDGVDLFAPCAIYGEPDDLRRLVDRAHSLGLGVMLDVVYNHLGPDGAYLGQFSPHYFNSAHQTPWGAAVNLDGPGCRPVRELLVENARHWVHEYHLDGLRLDACHALVDESPRHVLAELQERVRAGAPHPVLIVAEDSRNLVNMVQPESEGGWGLDAVWADDLHHQVRVALAGDRDGYYRDFDGSPTDIARTLEAGWFYQGQRSDYEGGPRGTDPRVAPPRRFVVCVQNHDQVGNRALGERLHHQVDEASWRAASALLLLAPETPLIFMGQEWSASSPFLYFTDHEETVGRLVTEGRRKEFAEFAAFAAPEARARIPDPQSPRTFEDSCLDWAEREQGIHASALRLYRALFALRRERGLGRLERGGYAVSGQEGGLVLEVTSSRPSPMLVVAHLGGGALVASRPVGGASPASWKTLLCTEDPAFTLDPRPPTVEPDPSGPRVTFRRSGVLVLAPA